MDRTLVIRRATPADGTSIGAVHVASWQATYRGMFPDAYLDGLDPAARGQAWAEYLAHIDDRPAECTLVAELDDTVIGFAAVGACRDEPASAVGEVWSIYLHPDAIGRGVGGALFARAVDELVARGFDEAVLWVIEANARARTFYERAGWLADGGARDDLSAGSPVPEVRYRRRLRPES